jgi:hypothetical protein
MKKIHIIFFSIISILSILFIINNILFPSKIFENSLNLKIDEFNNQLYLYDEYGSRIRDGNINYKHNNIDYKCSDIINMAFLKDTILLECNSLDSVLFYIRVCNYHYDQSGSPQYSYEFISKDSISVAKYDWHNVNNNYLNRYRINFLLGLFCFLWGSVVFKYKFN